MTFLLVAFAGLATQADTDWEKRLEHLSEAAPKVPYRFFEKGKEIARGTLRTVLRPSTVELEDTMEILLPDGTLHLTISQECARDRFLSPQKVTTKVRNGGTHVHKGKVKDGTLLVESLGRTRKIPLTDATITSFGLLRVVALLPEKKGTRVPFDLLEVEEFSYKPGHALVCEGEEEITLKKEKVKAWKWTHRSGTGELGFFWVRNGICVKVGGKQGHEMVFDVP